MVGPRDWKVEVTTAAGLSLALPRSTEERGPDECNA